MLDRARPFCFVLAGLYQAQFNMPLINLTATAIYCLLAAPVGATILLAWWSRRCRNLRRRRQQLLEALDERRDAHAIVAHTLFVDFPFLSAASIDFGLFRTFGIPSISPILCRSAQFHTNPGKRYDDTDLLTREFLLHHVDSVRGSTAIRRMNYLHGLYPIRNADFIYVLCIFIVCPMEFASRYGYREWTSKEKLAHFRVWHDIAMRMGIRDIPESLEEAIEYKERFEAEQMKYTDSNKDVAEATMKLFLADFPGFTRWMARRLIYALLDDGLREALGYPRQPRWVRWAVHGALGAWQGVFTRWFLPPRPLDKAVLRIDPVGCPMAGPGNDSTGPFRVTYRRFLATPGVYAEEGYKIEQLGAVHPGRLAPPPLRKKDGEAQELLCPMEACSNEQWPSSLLSKHWRA